MSNEIVLRIDPKIEAGLTSIAEIKGINFDSLVNSILLRYVKENTRLLQERRHLNHFTKLTLSAMR